MTRDENDVASLVERVLSEHRDAMRRHQTMSAEDVARMIAGVDAAVVARKRADGDVGPRPPLYFELERGAVRGDFLPSHASDGWEVSLDRAGRVLREGPERVYLYAATHVDSVQLRRDGTVGGVARMVLHERGHVEAWVRLAHGGAETTTTLYEWSQGRVVRVRQASSRFALSYTYVVGYADDGALESIVLDSDHVVYRRPTRAPRTLLRTIEREVRHVVEMAVESAPHAARPLYAVIVIYDGSTGAACFPPSIWLGPASIGADVAARRRPAEQMWNPLIDALPEARVAVRDALATLGAELDDATRDQLVAAYPKWAKRWTRELRKHPGVGERFAVLAFDPERESVDAALQRVLTAREWSALRRLGWLPSS